MYTTSSPLPQPMTTPEGASTWLNRCCNTLQQWRTIAATGGTDLSEGELKFIQGVARGSNFLNFAVLSLQALCDAAATGR